MALDRAGNLLGALALVITDRTRDAMADAGPPDRTGRSDTAAAALSALHHFLDRPTIDRLRQVLGLTSSGTVRLVDRLVEAGLVTRAPGDDARSTAILLTPAGRRAAGRIHAARAAVLDGALAGLSAGERRMLAELTGKVLAGLIREPGATRWLCRLCDLRACGWETGGCPVANAARERYQT